MIKVQNNTPTRESIPVFLRGLKQESLLDLSWTDPSLDVQDCAWYPEVDQSEPLGQYQSYGEETLTIDEENKRVIVTRSIVNWTQEEIDSYETQQRKAQVPASVSKRQARQQLIIMSLIDQVQPAIDSIIDSTERALLQSYWDDSTSYDRDHPQMIEIGTTLGLSEADLDNAFIAASKL